MRCYAPISTENLESLASGRAVKLSDFWHVSAEIKAVMPEGDAEQWEYVATQAAATSAWDSGLQVVLACDVTPDSSGSLRVEPADIACFLWCEPNVEQPDIADLSWFGPTEIAELISTISAG